MDRIRNKISNFKLKFNQIKTKFKAYLLSPECFDELFKIMKQMNVISIDLDEICFGFTNSIRHFISMINCIILWMTVLLLLLMFCSFDIWNNQFHLIKYNNQSRQLLFILIALLLIASMMKTDFILEEHNYNLRCLKLVYYLKYDLKQMHKLNDKHYKILTVLARLSTLFWYKIYFPLLSIATVLIVIETGILKESFLFNLLLLVIFYVYVITLTIFSGIFPLILTISLYYKFKMHQINQSIKSIANSNIIELYHLINEHNLITIEVHKLNLSFRRSMAMFFITSAIIEDMFIYLAIYSNNIFQKIFFSLFAIGYLFVGFALCYLISWASTSAHRSYKTIFSILNTRKTNLRLKIEVLLISN